MKKDKGYGSVAELTTNSFNPDKIFQFWLTKRNNNSSYSEDKKGVKTKRAYPTTFPVKLEEQIVYNGKATVIRHCIGEPSIFKTEQSPDRDVPKIVTKLNFVNGHRNVPGTETLILEYLALSNYNGSNPNRDKKVAPLFFLHDGNAAVEKIIDHEDKMDDVRAFIRDVDNFDRVMAYARVILGTEFDKISNNPSHVKLRMRKLAEGNPVLFMEGLSNPATLRKHYVLEAIEQEVLTLNPSTNALYWKRTGELLQQAPIGLSPINTFVDKVTEDRTGNTEVLYRMLLKELGVGAKQAAKKEEETVPHVLDNPDNIVKKETPEIEALIQQAISRGLIIKQPPASLYYHKGLPTQKYFVGFKGERGLIAALQKDPAFAEELRSQMGIAAA